MSNFKRNCVILAVFFILSFVGVSFAGKQDFVLVNESGTHIYFVYVSKASTNKWEEDVLDDDVLMNGSNITLRFNNYGNTRKWDMKVIYSDGESNSWYGIDLLETARITVRPHGKIILN